MRYTLTVFEEQHEQIKQHLLPDDGYEAVCLGLCGISRSDEEIKFLLKELVLIPHSACARSEDRVTWPLRFFEKLLLSCSNENWAWIKIHSHRSHVACFSPLDDKSDLGLVEVFEAWTNKEVQAVSAIMLPDGSMIGRAYVGLPTPCTLSKIRVVGHSLMIWMSDSSLQRKIHDSALHLFGEKTFALISALNVGVVGCSGTGSLVAEGLSRLGVEQLVLVDPDRMEMRNLNRVVNSERSDAILGTFKVHAVANRLAAESLVSTIKAFPLDLWEKDAFEALKSVDVLFGCVDSIDGRALMSRLCDYYCIPYIDLGVRLVAGAETTVQNVTGAVHYLQPGMSSLLDRGVFKQDQVDAALLKRSSPRRFSEQVKEGYMRELQGQRPAVITVNMTAAALALNELLARLHPYRYRCNSEFAEQRFEFADFDFFCTPEKSENRNMRLVAMGDKDYPCGVAL